MAARNVRSAALESMHDMDKLPSNTLKRHPKMDLNKNDLLRLLSYLEGELQARDISIAALKAEKAKQLLYQAKYGRFGLGDPFHALQRDSDSQRDNSFNETAVKAMYDNQLLQLENLIATQRKAQHRMREQLIAVEKRYHKVCAELEDEKRKHALDTAEGDDVTYLLEKDRERLKQELEFEKGQVKKLEKEGKKTSVGLEEEQATSEKHKQVALMLIQDRKRMVEKLVVLQHRTAQLEQALNKERSKTQTVASELVQQSQHALQMEAAMEKKLADFDTEREQLRSRLAREEAQNRELSLEILKLRQQVEHFHQQRGPATALDGRGDGPQSIEIRSSVAPRSPERSSAAAAAHVSSSGIAAIKLASAHPNKVFKNTPPNTPPESRRVPMSHIMRDSPDRDGPKVGPPSDSSGVKRGMMQVPRTSSSGRSPERTLPPSVEKPVPADKPADLNASSRVNASGSAVLTSQTGNTTVFTTPSGTRISLNVGPASSAVAPRKPIPAGRGLPPPVPPNKPQVYIPQTSSASSRRENMSHDPASTDTSSSSDASLSPNMDFFGPEMADLQQLLVSMATGSRESSPPSLDAQKLSPSLSASLSSPVSSDAQLSPLHKLASTGTLQQLTDYLANQKEDVDLNQPIIDGTTPGHLAAESGSHEMLLYLLEHGASANTQRDDKVTPLHIAAGEGHLKCLQVLLEHDGNVHQVDQSGWSALHWAASNGHADCCRYLLDRSARIDAVNNASWSPIHIAIHSGHVECLQLLLKHVPQPANHGEVSDASSQSHTSLVDDVINLVDKDGWTVAHLAAVRESKDCLEALTQHSTLDIERTDKWNRSVMEVAAPICKEFLQSHGSKTKRVCTVRIDLPKDLLSSQSQTSSHFTAGNVMVTMEMTWSELEEQLSNILLNHLNEMNVGLRTKRTSRVELDSPDGAMPFSLGISLHSVKWYSIGHHHWSPGTPSERSPFDMLIGSETRTICIALFGIEDNCQDALAYETLFSVATLQNYLRVIEQYKNVVFYGPNGTGKTFLAKKLAQCIQSKEIHSGNTCEVHFLSLTTSFSQQDLLNLMLDRGCLLPAVAAVPSRQAPILVLDDLTKVDVAQVFKDLLPGIENRGPSNVVRLKTEGSKEAKDYYVHPNCYILSTMDKTRSTGLELSIQQRFRWVQLRNDQEPIKRLLHRHLQRRLVDRYGGRLPSGEDAVYRTVEWVVCVWQRLNEGLGKLGLVDVLFGPTHFLSCPIELNKPKTVLRWLSLLWNHVIAPSVTQAVILGSGTETRGQHKVANTALYVLMQRAVVSGCPLTGQEKERYLSSFHGSNELDIKMRTDKKEGKMSGTAMPYLPSQSFPASPSKTMYSSKSEAPVLDAHTVDEMPYRSKDDNNLSPAKDNAAPSDTIIDMTPDFPRTPPEGAASDPDEPKPEGAGVQKAGRGDLRSRSPDKVMVVKASGLVKSLSVEKDPDGPVISRTKIENGDTIKGILLPRKDSLEKEGVLVNDLPASIKRRNPERVQNGVGGEMSESLGGTQITVMDENDEVVMEDPRLRSSSPSKAGADAYRNTVFALSGFPVSMPMVPQRSSSLQGPIVPANKVSKYGVPVIVTQPSASGSPVQVASAIQSSSAAMSSPRFSEFMSKSFEGDLPGSHRNRGLPIADVRRALSPQPEASRRPWSPVPDPRRSLSPGPEPMKPGWRIHRHFSAVERLQRGRAAEVVRPGSAGSLTSSRAPGSKFAPPLVVNPTKLPPFNGSSSLSSTKS